MPTDPNGRFGYPETGWSTGTIRKVGEAIRGDVGAAAGAFADNPVLSTIEKLHKGRKVAEDIIANHKEQIQQGLNQISNGEMSPEVFKRMVKQFGWQGDHQTGQFTDPNGQDHQMAAEAQ